MDRASIQERFGIIGSSPALHHVIDQMRLVSRTDVNVLIQGESGVGKEVMARAIHEMSARRHKALVIVNCGAIPEGLIESELFGAEKGAYTGSVERRTGYFEEADGGTIFLDEIGEMPVPAQVRLLRVLETGEFSRVGSSQVQKTDPRVIAATNKVLDQEVREKRFREDLYYRLSTVIISIPPLRERPEDILPLFENFLHQYAQAYNSANKEIDSSARELLLRYRWPGNVRELRNVAEQAVVLHAGATIRADDLRPYLRGVTASGGNEIVLAGRPGPASGAPSEGADARERELIYRALLELRLEIRELKEQVHALGNNTARIVTSEVLQQDDFESPDNGSYHLIVRDPETPPPGKPYESLFEDITYEIEGHEERQQERRTDPANGEEPDDAEPAPAFPTLEEAERQLISEALKFYEGNRRQTARALGISERTLYRKLKDLEAEL